MFDVVAVGELLIDFTPAGSDQDGSVLFGQHPGGAPANVLAAVSRLGGKTSFIGKVGTDAFGTFLRGSLEEAGIDTAGLSEDREIPTTLAFVHLDSHGDRSFSFYRHPGADLMLRPSDIPQNLVRECRILHFGSVSLTGEPSAEATLSAVRAAKEAGCIISYDPNYRPLLWNDEKTAKSKMLSGLDFADIVKVSKEEMLLLTGKADLAEGAEEIARHGASLVLVSLGPEGAFYRLDGRCGKFRTYDTKTVDTTGAGDAFLGAVLYRLKSKTLQDVKNISDIEIEDIVSFANAAGALATTKKGAIPAMPGQEEIEHCRKSVPLLSDIQ